MNRREFEQFYKVNIDRIYRYVFFRVRQNRDVCEDLVSEIFMKALKHFETYDEKVSKSAWIYRITQNHLANHYRDSKQTTDLEHVDVIAVDDPLVSIELKAQLLKLSSDDRKIVTMQYLLGYTYTEIGEIMGKSVGAVKMASHRALKQLKSSFAETSADEPQLTDEPYVRDKTTT